MLIDVPSVVVSPTEAVLLLRLCAPEITTRQVKGRPIPDELKRVLGDLARAAKSVSESGRSEDIPSPHTDPFRAAIVDGMTTRQAAELFGCTQRAVIARLHRHTLPGVQLPDGSWLVDIARHGANEGGRGFVAATSSPCGTPAQPSEATVA